MPRRATTPIPDPTPESAPLQAIRRLSMVEEVVTQVRRAIIAGEIAEGAAISEIRLAGQLQVSRVPVREALIELEHDGIVVFNQSGRCHVRKFTQHDIEEVLSLRLTLEVMSARLAAKNHQPGHLDALQRNVTELKKEKEVLGMSRLDVEFHDLIMAASGHSRLLRCWRTVRNQFEVLLAKAHRWQKSHRIPVNDHALRGHVPILEAIASRDSNRAAKEMLKHVREWGEWMPVINQ